jgi:hypothetical protein
VKVQRLSALQGFSVSLLAGPAFLPSGVLSWDQPLVQSSSRAAVSPLLVRRPRFAVGRSLGCAVFPRRALPSTVKAPGHPLVELASLQSLTQRHLASPPQQAGSPHGLLLPSALSGSKVHLSRALPARYVPPSGFGFPLGGFLPSVPCRFCFAPAALMGFALRSFLHPQGNPGVATGMPPRTVSPAVVSVAETTDRPGRPRFLGFAPCESP